MFCPGTGWDRGVCPGTTGHRDKKKFLSQDKGTTGRPVPVFPGRPVPWKHYSGPPLTTNTKLNTPPNTNDHQTSIYTPPRPRSTTSKEYLSPPLRKSRLQEVDLTPPSINIEKITAEQPSLIYGFRHKSIKINRLTQSIAIRHGVSVQ